MVVVINNEQGCFMHQCLDRWRLPDLGENYFSPTGLDTRKHQATKMMLPYQFISYHQTATTINRTKTINPKQQITSPITCTMSESLSRNEDDSLSGGEPKHTLECLQDDKGDVEIHKGPNDEALGIVSDLIEYKSEMVFWCRDRRKFHFESLNVSNSTMVYTTAYCQFTLTLACWHFAGDSRIM
jgi:hypothetical protein